jgi:hypothetical protein
MRLMTFRRWALAHVALVAGCTAAIAQPPPPPEKPGRPPQQTGDVSFKAVSDLVFPLGATVLIGARPADPADFKASFYASSASGACTSAMVGPRVLLTAAHCVANNGNVALARAQETWSGTCEHAPGYQTDETADWALCALDRDMPGVPYERVNTNASLVPVGAALLLTGFGCTQPGGTGGNDGIYRIGDAVVRQLPTSGSNDIVTKARGGQTAALCFGDSGGPAFFITNRQKRRRVQAGVNSRANIRDTSYLSSTSTADATTFLRDWSTRKGLKICGIQADVAGCRP